ncbi:MAG TPA: muconolactone Delta-isomerase family protein [Ktedonobacterales bacterium]|nr:muconolactone Delta-isomerase family protein [Ktedonobacterales bacterium]
MRFMVSIRVEVPPDRAEEVRALLPAERQRAAEHMDQGILEALYLDAAVPAPQIWAVMRAESLEAVQALLASYPLYAYFTPTYTQILE